MRYRTGGNSTKEGEPQETYIVRLGKEYFAGWSEGAVSGSDWTTVPTFATWTKDRRAATQLRIDTVVERQELMKIVIGFSRTKLIKTNMEEHKQQTRKPRIWKSQIY